MSRLGLEMELRLSATWYIFQATETYNLVVSGSQVFEKGGHDGAVGTTKDYTSSDEPSTPTKTKTTSVKSR